MRSDRRVGTGHAIRQRRLRDHIQARAVRRAAILQVSLTLAVVASACGTSTPPTASPSGGASSGQSSTPSTLALSQGCTDAAPCMVSAGHYTLSEVGVVPGLSLTVPSAGWRSTEQLVRHRWKDEVVRLYLAPIKVAGQSQTLLVALDAADDADLAHLAAEVAPIVDSIQLPAGAVAG